jgi:hypothetical protein
MNGPGKTFLSPRQQLGTVRKVAASAPGAMRSRSPEVRISSTGKLSFVTGAPASTSANRTGSLPDSRFRQL